MTMVADQAALVPQRQQMGGAARPQRRRARRDGWSKAAEAIFLETLAETCNASEAARAAGKCRAGAYRRRACDPAFARAWDAALDMGYAEIELMLMRAALFGSEVEEITMDGDGAVKARKVRRAPSLTVGLRLFLTYRGKVARIRADRAERPDDPDAVARVEEVMAIIRGRRAQSGE